MRSSPCSAVAAILCALAPVVKAQDENPSSSDFRRRASGDCAILGNYLYCEGGEISQRGDRTSGGSRFSRPFNLTLSLPLDSAWTTDDLELKTFERGDKPSVKFGSLWADQDSGLLYQRDGAGPYRDTTGADTRDLWVMEADGNGGGTWTIDNKWGENYTENVRGAEAASTTCAGSGYNIGGWNSHFTDSRYSTSDGNIPNLYMRSFDMSEGTWDRVDLNGMSPPDGTFFRGKATCVDDYVGKPLIFTSGGALTSKTTTNAGVRSLDALNVTFYDIESKQWLWQEATGNPPSRGRWQHCAVGVKSAAGTYELFVYGGYNREGDSEDTAMDDIWVLTIPGFHWTKVGNSNTPRAYQSCVVAGKKHMIVVGGLPGKADQVWPWDEKDELNNGIGVFDLSKLEWTNEYDPDAGDYETPDAVKKWYADGGMDDLEWSTESVKDLFGSVKVNFKSSSESNGSGSSNNNESGDSNSSNDDNKEDSSGSSTPVAAIAGGVVGGVAGLAAIGAAVFFYLRRRRRADQSPHRGASEVDASQKGYYSGTQPSYSHELQAEPFHKELQGSPASDLQQPGQGQQQQQYYHQVPTYQQEPSELDGSSLGYGHGHGR